MLPLRHRPSSQDIAMGLPEALVITDQTGAYGLPILWGELAHAASTPLRVTLQVRNSAGIPIIEGQTQIAVGNKALLFEDLRPIGIDAYSHKPATEQIQIAERIWSRRSSGTLQLQQEC